MRVLVAVYSKTFNTLKLANAIKETMGADLTRIEDKRPHGFILSGILAALRWKTAIKPCRTDLKEYDMLILCCPSWARMPPGAVNRYMADLKNAEGKKLAVAVTMGSTGGDQVAGRVRKVLEKKGMRYIDSLVLRTDDVQKGVHFQSAMQFAARVKSKAAMPYVVEVTKQKVGRLMRLLNTLVKIVK
jgi:NAD(P)H-dependent FMN reductase